LLVVRIQASEILVHRRNDKMDNYYDNSIADIMMSLYITELIENAIK